MEFAKNDITYAIRNSDEFLICYKAIPIFECSLKEIKEFIKEHEKNLFNFV